VLSSPRSFAQFDFTSPHYTDDNPQYTPLSIQEESETLPERPTLAEIPNELGWFIILGAAIDFEPGFPALARVWFENRNR
jgi:hypothetical protein